MKKADIKIHSIQKTAEKESFSDFYVTGEYGSVDGVWVAQYIEANDNMADSTTKIRVENPGTVVMSRNGGFSTRMVFEKKRRENSWYDTPFGGALLGIYTINVSTELDENGGKIKLWYILEFGGKKISGNKLIITVTVKEEET